MNDSQEFDDLYTKYSKGQCSDVEFDRLLAYLDDKALESRFESRIAEELDAPSLYEEDELVKNITQVAHLRILEQIGTAPVVRSWRSYSRYAIAAALAVVIGLSLYFIVVRDAALQLEDDAIALGKDNVLPGGNKATLTFSDGQTLMLDDAQQQIRSVDGGIVYADGKPVSDLKSSSLVTMTTPRGGQYEAVLPDGTKVWLNAESSISFPVQFAKNERIVQVEGELFFEVSHDTKHPFKVIMPGQEITVKGTSFNIHAYRAENKSQTTLVTGKVAVSTDQGAVLDLKPGQMLFNSGGQTQIKEVNTEASMAWKNGDFFFDKEPLQSVMTKISRWYDVDIVYVSGKKIEEVYGGSISRKISLREVLDVLEQTGDVRFKIEGNKVLVQAKK